MRVLFVVGTDLSANNSAAMCHNAYIRGMYNANHEVHVLTVKATAGEIAGRISGVHYIEYSDENFFVKLARKKRNSSMNFTIHIVETDGADTIKSKFKAVVKKPINKLIGASCTWKKRAEKYFCSEKYDIVISLASPADSHIVASRLLKSGRILATHSCQIWEDPWATDLYGGYNKKLLKKENKILNMAEKVIYVTPLTLKNQKALYPSNQSKMSWLPLPIYYDEKQEDYVDDNKITYGYFGQYYPNVRNLKPFYEVAKKNNKNCIICGDPKDLFNSTNTIEINGRISPDKLREKEIYTDVLVCVCNLGGGQIPGKIYQYSGTNKPILFILDGNCEEKETIRKYFGQFNRYVFCDNTEKEISDAMEYIEKNYHLYDRVSYFDEANIATEIIKLVYN